jgi:formylglycine-generating enzyme required for sulfatase activity
MSVSLSGGIVGTPHYLAPEIWHNQPATPATDLYALGCMLYEMALGRKAFPGDTSPAIMTAHLLQPLDLPEAWPEGVPAGLSDVLQKALAREPEARFGQVAALVAALDALAVDPLAEPYAALEAAVAGEQWDAALRLAEDIRAQAPDYRDVETLLQQAQAGQERAQREQLAEQWKAQAHAALEAGQYEVTRAAAERWLQLLPEDKAAKALLARANAELQSEDAPGVVSDQGKAHSGGIRQTPPRSEQQPADQRNMPLWVWGAIGAVVLALVVGLGALFNSMNAEPTDVPPVEEVSASSTPTETPRSPTNTPSPTAASTSTSTPTRTPMPTSTPTVQPTLYPVATRVRGIDGMTMVYVPAGEFEMGSTEEQFQEVVDQCVNAGNDRDDCERWYGDEQPVHTVTLDAFWLDQTEVSVAQFRQFVNATDYETTVEERGSSFAFTDDGWGVVEGADWAHPQGPGSRAEDDHPVVHVSWHDAEAYCAWAGGRLPTEAEWEYAARGPESFAYPWGDDFDCAKGNFATDCGSDDYDHTSPVGSFLEGASWVNAYDLSGNVWEWVADWYAEDYYAQSPRENPTGPTSGDYRVLRGGSWFLNERHVRGANRDRNVPPATFVFGGFRCVAVAAPGE